MMTAGAGGTAAAAAAISEAIKASGVIVKIEERDFEALLRGSPESLVIHAPRAGLFQRKHRYLTNYRGFTFFTESELELMIPKETEVVRAKQIWTPA
jgi:hypothetical protein